MLREAFTERLKQAMRAKDARTVSTVRLILAALKDRDIAARGEGNTAGHCRTRNPAHAAGHDQAAPRIDRALSAGQPARTGASRKSEEIAVIESFLPKQMSDEEIAAAAKAAIAETGAAGIKDMGKVMARVARAPRRRHRHGPRRRGREAAARVGSRTCRGHDPLARQERSARAARSLELSGCRVLHAEK